MFLENIKLKKLIFPDYNLQSAVFLCLTLLLSVAVFAASVYESRQFSAAQFTVIFATLIFSALSGQYQTTIPKTGIKIKSQDFIIFWSVIWLGVSASVLVAAASLLAGCFIYLKDKKRGLFAVSVGVISTFAAASVFYLTEGCA